MILQHNSVIARDSKVIRSSSSGIHVAIAERLRQLKSDGRTVYHIYHHPRSPLIVKVISIAALIFILSPVDLIPDVIPVLGVLDDLILIPVFVAIIIRLTPEEILEECRANDSEVPRSRIAAGVIILLWLGSLTVAGMWLIHILW